jgi:hypothetical protein
MPNEQVLWLLYQYIYDEFANLAPGIRILQCLLLIKEYLELKETVCLIIYL